MHGVSATHHHGRPRRPASARRYSARARGGRRRGPARTDARAAARSRREGRREPRPLRAADGRRGPRGSARLLASGGPRLGRGSRAQAGQHLLRHRVGLPVCVRPRQRRTAPGQARGRREHGTRRRQAAQPRVRHVHGPAGRRRHGDRRHGPRGRDAAGDVQTADRRAQGRQCRRTDPRVGARGRQRAQRSHLLDAGAAAHARRRRDHQGRRVREARGAAHLRLGALDGEHLALVGGGDAGGRQRRDPQRAWSCTSS